MADAPLPICGRYDVRIDASRCLRMRYSASSCRRCADICPHGAVSLDGSFSLDRERCRACLLCTSVCPVGAAEQSSEFSTCLAQLARVPDPVLGCIRTKDTSNAALPCLGGLSEEHLLALCHSLSGKLILNLSVCTDCPNSAIVPHLRRRLAMLGEAGLLEGGCSLAAAESAAELCFRDEAIGRRGFFRSLRNSLFQSAAEIVSGSTELCERRSGYAEKRVPVRRQLLNGIAGHLCADREKTVRSRYNSLITFSGNCTSCQGCVAICPTGALRTESGEAPPQCNPHICTGCGLCVEFCLDGAAQMGKSA